MQAAPAPVAATKMSIEEIKQTDKVSAYLDCSTSSSSYGLEVYWLQVWVGAGCIPKHIQCLAQLSLGMVLHVY